MSYWHSIKYRYFLQSLRCLLAALKYIDFHFDNIDLMKKASSAEPHGVSINKLYSLQQH
jgi:hypothetical protein